MSSHTKFIKELQKRIGVPIVRTERASGPHVKVWVEGLPQFFTIPLSTSDWRAVLNSAADIRRALKAKEAAQAADGAGHGKGGDAVPIAAPAARNARSNCGA